MRSRAVTLCGSFLGEIAMETSDRIKLEQHGEDGWFFATVEDADGLLSFGPTKKETLLRLAVTKRLWKEGITK